MSPQGRLTAGAVGLVAVSSLVRRDRVGRREVRLFRLLNELPDGAFAPVWLVMQGGALGAAPAAAVLARATGRPRLAGHLLAAGSSAWVLAKVVKVFVRRPRPVSLLAGTRLRGREATGLGYLSGHAAVAVALAAATRSHLGPGGRALAASAVPVIGLARVYVGAHLPLDVLGGAALGLLVEGAVASVLLPADGLRPTPGRPAGPARGPARPAPVPPR